MIAFLYLYCTRGAEYNTFKYCHYADQHSIPISGIYFFTFTLIINVLVLVCLMACYSTWVINSLKNAFVHHWWGLTLYSVYFKGFRFKEECILSQDPCHYGIMMANMLCNQLCVWGLDLSPWPSNRSHLLGSNNSWVYWWIFQTYYWSLCK